MKPQIVMLSEAKHLVSEVNLESLRKQGYLIRRLK